MAEGLRNLYPATPAPEPEGGAIVVFCNLPEAITYGANDEEVTVKAAEVRAILKSVRPHSHSHLNAHHTP